MFATMVGNDVAVELIVRSFRRLGLNVDNVNHVGMTALLIAVECGHIECATILASEGRANIRAVHPRTQLTAEQMALTSTGCALRRSPVVWSLTPLSLDGKPEACQSIDEEDFCVKRRSRRLVSLIELTSRSDGNHGVIPSGCQPPTAIKSSGVNVDAIPEIDDSVSDELDDVVETTHRCHTRCRIDEESSGRLSREEPTAEPVGPFGVDRNGYHGNGCDELNSQLRRTSLPSIRVSFNDGGAGDYNVDDNSSTRYKIQRSKTVLEPCTETETESSAVTKHLSDHVVVVVIENDKGTVVGDDVMSASRPSGGHHGGEKQPAAAIQTEHR